MSLERKISQVCKSAAVVVYVRDPVTRRVFPRATGNHWRAWFIINAN